MKLLLDMDGVLVDFVGGACALHNLPRLYDDPAWHGIWKFDHLVDNFWDAIDDKFWAGLPWLPDGKDILYWLEGKFGQSNICLLTSPPHTNHAGAVSGKMEWVKKHLPDYTRQILIGPCKEFCAHPNSLLVDDNDGNVNRFVSERGHGYLLPRLWNSKHRLASDSIGNMKLLLAGV